MNALQYIQKLGRALMLPIATLPAAALLLRFGQSDVLDIEVIAKAGASIFDNLPLLFAIGVAVGLSKGNAGASGLAAAVGYVLLQATLKALAPDVNLSVLGGIIAGLVAAWSYNRFHTLKLPEFLSFFGGSRFVPIATAGICLLLSLALSVVWPPIQSGLDSAGGWMMANGPIGSFVFGTLNRLLIPTGLHQVLNSLAWFVFGDYQGVTGDLSRFFAGDPSAGLFMTGFFPIMIFGLPAACLAMYMAARKVNRPKIAGMLFSVGLTSAVTGITEPLEFMFMFIAPVLYLVHALLTGSALALCSMLDIHLGFGFSAGFIDYALNFNAPAAKNAWMLIPIGLAYGVLYYLLFYITIRTFNLETIGRESEAVSAADGSSSSNDTAHSDSDQHTARQYMAALGGCENLDSIDACITRLRLTLNDPSLVDEAALKSLGSKGLVRLGKNNLQVIIGPYAEIIANHMNSPELQKPRTEVVNRESTKVVNREAAAESNTQQNQSVSPPEPAKTKSGSLALMAPISGEILPIEQTPDEVFADKIVGDGIAINPTGNRLVAPCSGVIGRIFETNHAYSIETPEGVELFVHFGIDTVELKGEGFKRIAEEGQAVQAGDTIIELDLELLQKNAKSIITPIVISNIDDLGQLNKLTGSVVAGKDTVLTVEY
jgi:N-acetylglucosamine PTS system EIICBA or EIICB component